MVRTKGPMPDPHIRAAFYLSPTLDQWWRWEDSGQVLAWRDGSTIAFAAEVETVMGQVARGFKANRHQSRRRFGYEAFRR
jgi:hypothetical protein